MGVNKGKKQANAQTWTVVLIAETGAARKPLLGRSPKLGDQVLQFVISDFRAFFVSLLPLHEAECPAVKPQPHIANRPKPPLFEIRRR